MNYLTFDIDWASDAIFQETVSFLKKYNAKATFFATHLSPFIKELEKDSDFEIGLHPNFNNLLNGYDKNNKNYQQVVDELKAIYPDALGVCINPDYVRQIVDEHCNKGINHRLLLWSFMNFEWWCRLFLNNEKF